MNAKINRKSFAKAAATLSHDDYNELVVFDPETGEFETQNRATPLQGNIPVMHGDTGYETDGMTEKDFENFFMSDAFDFSEIELAIAEAQNDDC